MEQATEPISVQPRVPIMQMRKMVLVLAAVAASLGIAASAAAQVYPSHPVTIHPVTIIVPFTAGGPSDTLTRIVAERMRAALGQPIIIDNVGGAAGRIGTGRGARAAPARRPMATRSSPAAQVRTWRTALSTHSIMTC
jgi:tripartite-type tricarboxylate transporter receptor subunit TctC